MNTNNELGVQPVKIKGKRGRKPVLNKKKQVVLHIRVSKLETEGGEDALKSKLYAFLGINPAD